MAEHHLSPQAYARLSAELEERSTTRKVELSKWIETAREHGDIRENADFDAAKNEQALNQARIRQLDTLLKAAIVVEGGGEGDVVGPGVIVEIRMGDDDETTTYLFGNIEERHDTHDVLSTSSPLGEALVGHSVGEIVSYQGPRRTFSVEIVSVSPVD